MKINVVKDVEYYRQFEEIVVQNRKELEDYIEQAERCKRIYYAANRRSGWIYRLIAKFAKWENKRCIERGTAIAEETMRWCLDEAAELLRSIDHDKDES